MWSWIQYMKVVNIKFVYQIPAIKKFPIMYKLNNRNFGFYNFK